MHIPIFMTGAMHGTGEAYLFERLDLTVIKFIKEKNPPKQSIRTMYPISTMSQCWFDSFRI
jgi:hypothetical protein